MERLVRPWRRTAPAAEGRARVAPSQRRRDIMFWMSAVTVSATMVGFLALTAGVDAFRAALRAPEYSLIICAAVVLSAANLPHANRLKILLRPVVRTTFRQRITLTLRYGLYVVIFPVRLGEIAYMLRLNREFRLPPAVAFALAVQQRLFDLVVLGGLALVVGLTLVSSLISPPLLVLFGGIVLSGALLTAARAPEVMTLLAGLVSKALFLPALWRRNVVSGLVQARRWARTLNGARDLLSLLGHTFVEWILNLAAIALVIAGLGIRLPAVLLLGVASMVLVAGAIPVHTIGGVGVVEVGLAGALYLGGIPMNDAVAVALVARIVLLGVPILLWIPAALLAPLDRVQSES